MIEKHDSKKELDKVLRIKTAPGSVLYSRAIQRQMEMSILIGKDFIFETRKFKIIYTNHRKKQLTAQLDNSKIGIDCLPVLGSTVRMLDLDWHVIHTISEKNKFTAEVIVPEEKKQ